MVNITKKMKDFKKRTDDLALDMANYTAELEGLTFEYERYAKDFAARKCSDRFLVLE